MRQGELPPSFLVPQGVCSVGFLYYGNNSYPVEIDDRPLAHLKIVLLSLLRSGKSAAFCFDRSTDIGSGRETLWISPSTEIRFRFNGNRPPRINEQWLQLIAATSNAPTGLRLVAEPADLRSPSVGRVIRHRVLIDIEFAIDETKFKLAQLVEEVAGISDVTETGVREAVTAEIIHADWAAQGLLPQRGSITTRICTPSGKFVEILLPPDTSVIASEA